jgi:hypothetical protein
MRAIHADVMAAERLRYLEHEDERVRAYARRIESANALARAELWLVQVMEELSEQLLAEEYVFSPVLASLSAFDGNDEDQPF